MRRRPWPRGLTLTAMLALACGDPPVEPVPILAGPGDPEAWAHAIGFRDGVVLDAIAAPDVAVPGQTLRVSFTAHGPVDGLRARVVAWPPRAGARQVALGGVGAPPVEVPQDARAVTVERALTTAAPTQVIEIPVPAPWHPRQLLVTVELLDGPDRVPALRGPRREDGVGLLAVVDVPAQPTAVVAAPMASPPTLDGRLDEPGWAAATPHPLVQSLDGEPYDERPGVVRLAWDAQALYLGAQITDPDVWSDLMHHDDPLWNQEVLELFVFGDAQPNASGDGYEPPSRTDYLELQVSPRGVTFDARFAQYRKGDEAWDGTWRAAVDVQGTLDERRDRDEGWSAELAVPWAEICEHTEVSCPPAAGQQLRINVFRFERPAKQPPIGLALSPPRVPDFHAPEHAAVLELGGP